MNLAEDNRLAASELGKAMNKLRWANTTPEHRKAHAKMMSVAACKARSSKHKANKPSVTFA